MTAARLKYSGQLPRAIEICQELLQIVKVQGIEKSIAGGAVDLLKADLIYELNQLEEASQLMRENLHIIEKGHDVAVGHPFDRLMESPCMVAQR